MYFTLIIKTGMKWLLSGIKHFIKWKMYFSKHLHTASTSVVRKQSVDFLESEIEIAPVKQVMVMAARRLVKSKVNRF